MIDARRTNRVGVARESRSAFSVRVVADDQIALEQKDLFPIGVHERRHRIDARLELQQTRAVSLAGLLVDPAGDDLLLDAVRIAFRRMPAFRHVELAEFVVNFLGDHHHPLSGSDMDE